MGTHPRPLDGVKVLDLSRVLAAPFCSQILGDMGANIIKVERPHKGDDSRMYGPAFLEGPTPEDPPQSAFYLSANRNKRSITIDISKQEGQELVRDLAKGADIVLENFRVGTLARYRLDYASLSAINSRLVYCSITAYGQTGPCKSRPGYDGIFQAAGGLMSVTGLPDDQPGGGPMKVGPSIADIIAGYNATIALLGALRHRDHVSGHGQYIDIALFDSIVAAASHYTMEYLVSGKPPVRKGTEGNGGMPSGVFRTKDRPIMLAVGTNEQYQVFCAIIGRPDLATHPDYITVTGRSNNRRPLVRSLDETLTHLSSADLVEQFDKAGVPCSYVNNYHEVFASAQAIHRGLAVNSPHPYTADLRHVANPIRYSETPLDVYASPPFLGQNTDEILTSELGWSAEKIAALRQRGII
jgi:crotonobetainyl-CoA:carnitine CoA-transferase CaiB-like acyl-CoA transferase